MTRTLTTEERVALGWPEEAAGVDTIRRPARARAWRPYGGTEDVWSPSGPITLETAEGGIRDLYPYGLRKGLATEAEAIEAGNAWALRTMASLRRQRALMDRWGATAQRMAPGNRRGHLGEGWTLSDHHRPVEGEHVKVWAHGGYRVAIVVETTKGRGVTVAYATPSSPQDVHLTKTTKYAVSTGIRPMSMGV